MNVSSQNISLVGLKSSNPLQLHAALHTLYNIRCRQLPRDSEYKAQTPAAVAPVPTTSRASTAPASLSSPAKYRNRDAKPHNNNQLLSKIVQQDSLPVEAMVAAALADVDPTQSLRLGWGLNDGELLGFQLRERPKTTDSDLRKTQACRSADGEESNIVHGHWKQTEFLKYKKQRQEEEARKLYHNQLTETHVKQWNEEKWLLAVSYTTTIT